MVERPNGRFIGRRQELELLSVRLEGAFVGRGGLVLLGGEAGVGKTRLGGEFGERARERGAIVLSGGCYEGDWQPDYGPFIEAIRKYQWAPEPQRPGSEVSPSVWPLARLIPDIIGAPPGVPALPHLQPVDERLRLFDGFVQFVLAIARQTPTVILLDDLQWADGVSLQLLRYLGRYLATEPVLVLGIHRELELDANPQHPLGILRRESDCHHLSIRGFDHDELATYLAETTGQAMPKRLAEDILAQTKGNPFYAGEIARHLAETGLPLSPSDPAELWGVIELPRNVRQAVRRRLSHLSLEAQNLLRSASIFIRGFRLPVIQSLEGTGQEILMRATEEAVKYGFVQAQLGAPPAYDFTHDIVRQAIYDDINPDRRECLHRRAAESLEEVYAGRLVEHAVELAAQYHLSAGLPGASRGVAFALMASDHAQAGYAHEQAVKFLRMARGLLDSTDPALRAAVLCRLAIAEAEALMLTEAAHSVEEALAALDADRPAPEREARFLAEAAAALKEGGAGPDVWEPLVTRGLGLVEGRRGLTWARLELLRDRFHVVSAGPVTAVRWLEPDVQAVDIVRSQGTEEDYVMSLHPAVWRSYSETNAVLKLVRSWKQPTARMRALDLVGRDLVELHYALPEAIERFLELADIGRQCGSISAQAEAHFQLAGTWTMLGDFAQGELAAGRARELIGSLGPQHRLRAIELTLSMIQSYYRDEWDAALAAIRTLGETMADQERNPFALAGAAGVIFVFGRTGMADEARGLLSALTPVAEQMDPTTRGQNAVVTGASSAIWDLELVEYAERYRRMALALVEAGVGGGPVGPNEMAAARMAALLGDMEQAEEYFGRARRLAKSMDMGHMTAIIDHDEALALMRGRASSSDRASALLEAASRGFRAYGMEAWEKRTLESKRRLADASAKGRGARGARGRSLTRRETQVLQLVAAGKTNREIAAELTLSQSTVERHIANIYTKIDVRGRAAATAHAFKVGLMGDATQDA